MKYYVRDWCQDSEPRVLNIQVQSYLLKVIVEILVKCSVLIIGLFVLSVVSINTVIY